jgi:hypothetical protein
MTFTYRLVFGMGGRAGISWNYSECFSTVDEYYCWTVCRDVTEAEYNIIQNNVQKNSMISVNFCKNFVIFFSRKRKLILSYIINFVFSI